VARIKIQKIVEEGKKKRKKELGTATRDENLCAESLREVASSSSRDMIRSCSLSQVYVLGCGPSALVNGEPQGLALGLVIAWSGEGQDILVQSHSFRDNGRLVVFAIQDPRRTAAGFFR
jgi:hypothetical protein